MRSLPGTAVLCGRRQDEYTAPVRIFALETDITKVKKRYLSEGEREILTVHYHWMRFFYTAVRQLCIAAAVVVFGVLLARNGLPGGVATAIAVGIGFFAVVPRLVRSYLDWKYDFLVLTTDKVVIVDQSSIIRQRATPMNLENFASASSETQMLNLFPFGMLRLNLKEGTGENLCLMYVPDAENVAARIAEAVTYFQRRKDLRRYAHGEPMPEPPDGVA